MIDQSPTAALRRIQLQLRDDAPYLLHGRVRIIKYAIQGLPSLRHQSLTVAVSGGHS